jgi:uncharacterized Zn finger protein (UPF0148 family)
MKEACPRCDAPMLISKKGNLYCSKICWKTSESTQERLMEEAIMESNHGDWGDRE